MRYTPPSAGEKQHLRCSSGDTSENAFPGHATHRERASARGSSPLAAADFREVSRAISENEPGRGQLGAPTSAPVSVTDAVSDPATPVH
jgi:hypothetical protein